MLEDFHDVLARIWSDLLSRPRGPMSFRFLLQPGMAAFLGIRDGMRDGRTYRAPYFWSILTQPEQRGPRLREGLRATGRVLLLGLGMDAIYQFIAYREFYPFEAAIVAATLGFVPYLLIRGPADRITRWWLHRQESRHAPHTPK